MAAFSSSYTLADSADIVPVKCEARRDNQLERYEVSLDVVSITQAGQFEDGSAIHRLP